MRRLLLLALALMPAMPATALAHVTVLPESSRPGQTADLTFRVPNERDDAATVQIDVFLAHGVPAKIEPHEGWTATRVGDEVRWAADGDNTIRPGRTEDFKVKLGPLPDLPRIVFKALQHYADGQIVRWIQDPTSDAERPAAVLELGGGQVLADGLKGPEDHSSGLVTGLLVLIAAVLVLMFFVWRRWRV
jgi:uncharacterized protein YcnI